MGPNKPKFIAYLRASTARQGASGLGLDAQQAAAQAHAQAAGGAILRTYIEVESGKKSDRERPELAAALADCKQCRATLLVAKLDRLGRNVAFLSALMESDAEFVAADQPHASRLILHVLAAFAEEEARAISARTKAALAAARVRGVLLGSARPGAHRFNGAVSGDNAKGNTIKKADTHAADAAVAPLVTELRAGGLTLRAIAANLNDEGYVTRRGRPWNPTQVSRVLSRAGV
jgi:DNA invertase Pin-like site-specific DNA recombinase